MTSVAETWATMPSARLNHAGRPPRVTRDRSPRRGAHGAARPAHRVGPHQGAVGVVVLEEGDQAGGDRDHLHRRDVHELDVFGLHHDKLGVVAGVDEIRREAAVLVQRRVGLRDDVLLLGVGRHVDHLAGDLAVDNLAVGALDEAETVDLRMSWQEIRPMLGLRASRWGRCARSAGVHVAHPNSARAKPGRNRGGAMVSRSTGWSDP